MHVYNDIYTKCKQYMNHNVRLDLHDGRSLNGFIRDVSNQTVTFDMQEEFFRNERSYERFFYGPGYGYGYPYPGYPVYPGYGFRRLILPLTAIAALSLLSPYW